MRRPLDVVRWVPLALLLVDARHLTPWPALGLAGVAALGLTGRPALRGVSTLAAALLAYLAAASQPAVGVPLLALYASVALVLAASGSRLAVALVVTVIIGLGLVAQVLGASSFASSFVGLLAGLLAGGAVFMASQKAPAWHGSATALLAGAIALFAGGGVPGFGASTDVASVLPGYATARAALSTEARCDSLNATLALQRLAVAGFRDAAQAHAAAALLANADPELLRRLCPSRGRNVGLPESCTAYRSLGEAACAAVRRLPEDGVQALLGRPEPSLSRLAGDLAFEAGDLLHGQSLYEKAGAAGDAYAAADLERGLVERHRLPARPAPQSVADYQKSLASFSLEAPARRGLVSIGAPGTLFPTYEPSLGRYSLNALTRFVSSFTVRLPLPPDGRVPVTLGLTALNRRGLRLELENAAGATQVYGCEAGTEPLPDAMCAGRYATATLHPTLAGPLRRFVIRGEFALAGIDVEMAP